MRTLLQKTLLFLLITFVMLLLALFALRKKCDRKEFFEIPQNVTTLFAGHSHVRLAINDSLMHGVLNVSEEGEAYIYTLQKLRTYLHHNPQIRRIYLECTNNSFSKYYDSRSWSAHFIKTKLPDYNTQLDKEDFTTLMSHEPMTMLGTYPISARTQLEFLTDGSNDFPTYAGWFKHRYYNYSHVDSLLHSSSSEALDPSAMVRSDHATHYVRKIADLCTGYNVELVLLRCPLHPSWPYFSNEEMFMKTINEKFADLPFADFARFSLDNSEFRDLAHLNCFGSERFSHFLDSINSTYDYSGKTGQLLLYKPFNEADSIQQ